MPATGTPLDTDLVLDQLVDECHVIQAWVRDILELAVDAVDDDDLGPDAFRRGPDPDRSAWTIVMSLLAADARWLPTPVVDRLQARVPGLSRDLDPHQYEADGSSLLCQLVAVAATASAADSDDHQAAPDMARSMVDGLHQRLRVCVGCMEWLAGMREGKLVHRNIPRDTKLAERAYNEAVALLHGEWD